MTITICTCTVFFFFFYYEWVPFRYQCVICPQTLTLCTTVRTSKNHIFQKNAFFLFFPGTPNCFKNYIHLGWIHKFYMRICRKLQPLELDSLSKASRFPCGYFCLLYQNNNPCAKSDPQAHDKRCALSRNFLLPPAPFPAIQYIAQIQELEPFRNSLSSETTPSPRTAPGASTYIRGSNLQPVKKKKISGTQNVIHHHHCKLGDEWQVWQQPALSRAARRRALLVPLSPAVSQCQLSLPAASCCHARHKTYTLNNHSSRAQLIGCIINQFNDAQPYQKAQDNCI